MGVEPIRCHHQRILSPSRLPIPTHRLICCLYSILQACQKIKIYFALIFTAIPHNSKCRYGERGAADAKPKAQIILDAAKVSAASGGNSEPKQGQWSQSARGFCPRSTMRVPQPDIIEHFGNADAVPQLPERCLSRKAGIVRCCLIIRAYYLPLKWRRFLLYTWLRYRCPAHTHSRQSLHYQRFRSKSRNTGQ